MAEIPQSTPTITPRFYDSAIIGTAAGTTTIGGSVPVVLHSLIITPRKASGAITLYDSIGTSTTVLGTITQGTQVFSDPPLYILDLRTNTALTIVNSADTGAIVTFAK